MWDTLIGGHIRRANRNLFLLNLCLALGVAGILLLNTRYLFNVFRGPNSISRQELTGLKDADALYRNYVTVQGEATQDTGLRKITQRKSKYSGKVTSETVDAVYLVTRIGDRALIVRAPGESTATTFTGALQPIPDDVRQQLDLKPGSPVLPFMLDAKGYSGPAYALLWAGIPTLLFCGWNLWRVRQRTADPTVHPLARLLGKYGPADALAQAMDQEFKTAHRQIGNIIFTTSWIVRPTTFGANLLYMGDLIWSYKKVTQHRTNFVPTHKTYSVVIKDRSGGEMEFEANEAQTEELMAQIHYQLPWAVLGYDQELENLWNKDRAGFIAAVDQRRAELLHGAGQEQAQAPAQAPA